MDGLLRLILTQVPCAFVSDAMTKRHYRTSRDGNGFVTLCPTLSCDHDVSASGILISSGTTELIRVCRSKVTDETKHADGHRTGTQTHWRNQIVKWFRVTSKRSEVTFVMTSWCCANLQDFDNNSKPYFDSIDLDVSPLRSVISYNVCSVTIYMVLCRCRRRRWGCPGARHVFTIPPIFIFNQHRLRRISMLHVELCQTLPCCLFSGGEAMWRRQDKVSS